MKHRHAITGTLIAVATALTACGSDDPPAARTTTPASTPAISAAGTEPGGSEVTPSGGSASFALNAAEVTFAQGMIAHHEQAIEMAEIALDPKAGASASVVDLATRIKGAQDPEVALMTGWLTAAGQPVAMDISDGHDMSSMEGMMSAEQMDALATTTGAAFDTAWLTMMIEHHQGAVSQSKTVQSAGTNPAVLALAGQIIKAQQAEITEMSALLSR